MSKLSFELDTFERDLILRCLLAYSGRRRYVRSKQKRGYASKTQRLVDEKMLFLVYRIGVCDPRVSAVFTRIKTNLTGKSNEKRNRTNGCSARRSAET